MTEKIYLNLFKENIINDYEKGGDYSFNIDKDKLNNLFNHNNAKNDIKSDFAKFLEETLKEKINL